MLENCLQCCFFVFFCIRIYYLIPWDSRQRNLQAVLINNDSANLKLYSLKVAAACAVNVNIKHYYKYISRDKNIDVCRISKLLANVSLQRTRKLVN